MKSQKHHNGARQLCCSSYRFLRARSEDSKYFCRVSAAKTAVRHRVPCWWRSSPPTVRRSRQGPLHCRCRSCVQPSAAAAVDGGLWSAKTALEYFFIRVLAIGAERSGNLEVFQAVLPRYLVVCVCVCARAPARARLCLCLCASVQELCPPSFLLQSAVHDGCNMRAAQRRMRTHCTRLSAIQAAGLGAGEERVRCLSLATRFAERADQRGGRVAGCGRARGERASARVHPDDGGSISRSSVVLSAVPVDVCQGRCKKMIDHNGGGAAQEVHQSLVM